MNVKENTFLTSWTWIGLEATTAISEPQQKFDMFQPLRQRIDGIKVNEPQLAHRLCKLIPAQCPFQREIKFFGRTIVTIPPLCKLNPLYNELVALRFRAICYLADVCGEDISAYC